MLIRATPEGRKELVGVTDGARESAQDWRDLLLDLKPRGPVGDSSWIAKRCHRSERSSDKPTLACRAPRHSSMTAIS